MSEFPIMRRVWAMPNANTFDIEPIRQFVMHYRRDSKVSVDPFARNCGFATYTNDLNPATEAKCHMDSADFLKCFTGASLHLVVPDLVIFDPPYSLRQVKEVYDSIGKKLSLEDTNNVGSWGKEKDLIAEFLTIGGVVLSFGWNTIGMGKERGFRLERILLVCHGGAHNDTICIAERKIRDIHSPGLFEDDKQ